MKISFVEPHLKIFGGIRRIIELSNRLVELGHGVTIFHSDGSHCKWMKCFAEIKSYKELLKNEHDVIIFNDPNTNDYKLVKKAKAKLKIFYVLGLYNKELLIGFNPKLYLPNNRRMFMLKKCLASPYLKLANATWEKTWLKAKMNIESILLLGGVNTKVFYPVNLEKRTNEIQILCSGDPREGKGTNTILKAVEIAKKENPNIKLDTYYGKGIPQEKMAEKYSSADIFVDSSWHGGWNNPVAEAMACKVPVVCADIGSIKDFAFDMKTALVVPPKNSAALANAITRLIRDNKLRNELIRNAYEHIIQFDWDKSAKKLEEIIFAELEERKSRRLSSQISLIANNPRKIIPKSVEILRKITKKGYSFDKYKKFGAYHWESIKKDKLYKNHVEFILNKFDTEPKGSLLDIGCGDGLISCLLAEKGFRVKGVDAEKEAIKLAKERCSLVDFEVKDLYDLSEPFDYLLSSEVIEHIVDDDKFIKKISNLFKKAALITTPKKNYYKELDTYHIREYSFYEFDKLLEKHFEHFDIYMTKNNLYAWIKLRK